MQIELFCPLPDRARGRKWLSRLDDEGVLYEFFPEKRNMVSEARELLKNYDPLILHSHFSRPDVPAALLKMLFYRNAKLIWHVHSLAALTGQQRIKDIFKVKMLARHYLDRCITVGDGVYSNVLARGFPQDKVVLLRNGIDTRRFLPNPTSRASFRQSLGLSEEHLVFLLLGRDPAIKGVDLFVKAAAEAGRNNGRKVFFLIIGGQQTEDFVSKLPETARLGDGFRILPPTDDFPSLLNGVDVLVSASRTEAYSFAIAESMAAGKPVISSDIPGIRSIYGKSEGLSFFPVEGWQALSTLMKNTEALPPARRKFLGESNAKFVTEHYSLEKWVDQVGDLYRTLLTRS